jgi:sulfite reductase (NADPH) hemoprotein beta-component
MLTLPQAEIDRIRTYFADPAFDEGVSAESQALATARASDAEFDHWVSTNVVEHKKAGYAIVNISLKPIGGVPGDASDQQIDAVADLAERYSCDEVRVTHEQNLTLPHVKRDDLKAVYDALAAQELATPNIGMISDAIACPGLDYCDLANARSIPLAQEISTRFADLDRQYDIGELKVKISGCINACGHHHVGHIGILGVDKKGTEFYQISLGGAADENASLGAITGRAFTEDTIVDAIETLVTSYIDMRQDNERFIDTYRRVGMQPFKERLYAE